MFGLYYASIHSKYIDFIKQYVNASQLMHVDIVRISDINKYVELGAVAQLYYFTVYSRLMFLLHINSAKYYNRKALEEPTSKKEGRRHSFLK